MKQNAVLWLGIALVLIGGGVAVVAATRGYRNNNPLNIRFTNPPTPWQGWVGAAAQTDTEFVQFATMQYGIRAAARTLENYYSQGYQTISDIISRWAPPSENPTGAYIANVASATGLDAGAVLSFPDNLSALIAAMISQEQGVNVISDSDIQAGIAAA